MKRMLAVAAALAFTPLSAMAQSERISDAQYIAAARCVSFAALPQLQGDTFDVSALRAMVDAQVRSPLVRDQVRSESDRIRRSGARARDSASAAVRLRAQRDEACAGFISTGMVRTETPSQPS
jgi:hypothetical protein